MMEQTPLPHDADWFALPVRDRVLQRLQRAQQAAENPGSLVARNRNQRAPLQKREAKALRRVFLDLGDCYREYRRRTGLPVSTEVRDAAYAFQRNRDLDSLVTVAASLDRQDSLRW